MRSPLGVIVGSLDLLEQSQDEKFRDRQSKVMRSASDGMVRLMDDLLDITALENNRLRLAIDNVSVPILAEELCREFEMKAQEKKLSLLLNYDAELREIACDRQRLRQVLSNLISNALKYTDTGGVEVEIRAVDKQCRISVSDSGVGISLDMLNYIFEPFYRGASPAIDGAGLGLSISQKLLVLMGSGMTVDSVVGEGTTFWFELPFTSASA